MELGIVRSAIAGVTQPTPPAPEPVQTANKPQLDRARAVEPLAVTERPAPRRDTVALNTLPPASVLVLDAPPPADAEAPDKQAAQRRPERREPPGGDLQRRFDIDDSSKEIVFRMIDTSTGEVVRQFPEEDRLRLRDMLRAFGTIAPAGRTALYDSTF